MRVQAALLVLAVLVSGLAGCIQGPVESASVAAPSLPRFDANKTLLERVVMKTKDGTSLVLAVNMSQEARDAGEKLPVIVDIGPYFGTGIMRFTAIDMRLAEYFVPRGYAVVRASLRGTGESEGCFDIGGKVEQQDVVEIVSFLGEQAWSNGNVAVFGKSYDGTTPWMAAINHAPHLKTIVPISGISDMYRYTFYDGTAYPEELGFETYYYLYVGEDVSIPGPDGGEPAWAGSPDTLRNSIHPCQASEGPEQSRADLLGTVTGDHGDPFWLERDYEPRFKDIDVPVFLVHGLHDWNVKMDHEMPLFDGLNVPKAAWFGQWEHNYPDVNTYKPEWSRHDWNETLLVWFDHWLKGVDNDWQKVAHVEAQDQLGAWRTHATWPPADAVGFDLALTAAGALASDAGAAKTATFRDPLGDGYQPATKANGLGFVTAPMPENVTLVGRPSLDLKLSVDQPGGNVAVALWDVDESGQWTQLDHGSRNLWHRDTREKGSPVTPGQAFNTTVWLYPQEVTIAKGHRLGFSVAGEIQPWIQKSPFAPEYSVRLGEGGSVLRLQTLAESAAGMRAALADAAAGVDAKPAFPALEILK